MSRSVALVLALSGCGPEPGVFRLAYDHVNAYVIVGPEGVALVDTLEQGRERWLLDELAELGIEPGDLDLIVLTHGHGDHAGSAAALRAITGAPIAIGAGDHAQLAELLDDGAGWFWPGHGAPLSARRVQRWLQRQ